MNAGKTVKISAGIDLLLALIAATNEVSTIVGKVREDGRDRFTPDEWRDILDANDQAREDLRGAIEQAQADEGPHESAPG